MKKVLLLLLIIIVIPFKNVYSASFSGSFTDVIDMDLWTSQPVENTGTNKTNIQEYHISTFTRRSTGEEAYCITPGKSASHWDPVDVSCSAVDPKSYPMTYYLANKPGFLGNDLRTKNIAFRTVGMMDSQSSYYDDTVFNDNDTSDSSDQATGSSSYKMFSTYWRYIINSKYGWSSSVDSNDIYMPNNWVSATPSYNIDVINIIADAAQYWNGRPGGATAVPGGKLNISAGYVSTEGFDGTYFDLHIDSYNKSSKMVVMSFKAKVPVAGQVEVKSLSPSTVQNLSLISFNPSTGEGQFSFKANMSSGCTAKISITGPINPNAENTNVIYKCDPIESGSGEQSFVVISNGQSGEEFTFDLDTDNIGAAYYSPGVEMTCKNCDDPDDDNSGGDDSGVPCKGPVRKDYVSGLDIHNCCKEALTSKVEEYKISDLFCEGKSEYLQLEYTKKRCKAKSGYKDSVLQNILNGDVTQQYFYSSQNESVSNYCLILCTEGLQIDVPKELESANGKFFKLEEQTKNINGVTYTTKGPIITGTKRCTIQIQYHKIRKKYQKAVSEEIEAFNKYQKWKALYDLTEFESELVEGDEIQPDNVVCKVCKPTLKPKGTENCLDSIGDAYKCEDDAGCECYMKISTTSENGVTKLNSNCENEVYYDGEYYLPYSWEDGPSYTPPKCKEKYWKYTLTLEHAQEALPCSNNICKLKYYSVSTNNGFKIDSNYNGNYSGLSLQGAYADTHQYERVTRSGIVDRSQCEQSVSSTIALCTNGYTGGSYQDKYKGSDKNLPEKNPSSTHSQAGTKAENQLGKFNTAKKHADTYENLVDKCESFFTSSGSGSRVDNYTLSPTAKFSYLQIFMDETAKKNRTGKTFVIDYGTAECDKTYRADDGGLDLDSTSVYYASSVIPHTEEKMSDVKKIEDFPNGRMTSSNGTTAQDSETVLNTAVRRDATYYATCVFKEPTDNKGELTLYPGPLVDKEVNKKGVGVNQTGHKYQYAIYLTTYKAVYQTYWTFGGLGSTSDKVKKFVKNINDASLTCAQKGLATSDGKAEDIKKTSQTETAFTCALDIDNGGMRIGTCPTGVYGYNASGTNIKIPCDGPDEINEVYEFRVVDPKNIFPSNKWTRDNRALNWKKDDGTWGRTKGEIEAIAAEDKTFNPENKTYSFKIDTKAIKAIREYNKNHPYNGVGSFEDYSSCTCNTNIDEKACSTINPSDASQCKNSNKWKYTCVKCLSNFITYLSNDSAQVFDGKSGSKALNKKVWNNSKSLDTIRNSTKWAS